MSDKEIWTIKLDWLNIVYLLGLESIDEISEQKKDKVIKKISRTIDKETLLDLDPHKLDKIVADELAEVMKKELTQKARENEKKEKELRTNFIPFNNGANIYIDPKDLKDFNIDMDGDPQEFLKKIAKKLFSGDTDPDDDNDKSQEDSTGYYI